MNRTAKAPQLLALLLMVGLAAVYAWYIVFTRTLSLDEAYLMISVRGFLAGHPLYDSIFTQYGPFYYVYEWFLHSVLRIPLTHDATRLVTVFHWILASSLLGLAANKLTKSKVAGMFVFFQGMVHLALIANEPGHPQEIIAALLALGMVIAVRNPESSRFIGLAILTAIFCLIKINVGILFGIALFIAVMGFDPKTLKVPAANKLFAFILGIPPFFIPILAVLPTVLMRRHLQMEWCHNYDLVATAAILAAYLIGSRRPVHASPFTTLGFLNIPCWFFLSAGVLIAVALIGGTSVDGLIDGLLLTPLNTPNIALLPIPIPNSVMYGSVISLFLVVLVRSRWNAEAPAWLPHLVTALKSIYGLVGTFALVGDAKAQLAFLAPWIWLTMIEPPGAAKTPLFPRIFLALAATWQLLQAYPIGGTQTNIATMLMVCSYAVCLADVWQAIRPQLTSLRDYHRTPLKILATCSFAVLFAFCWADIPDAKANYDTLTPLGLNGATWVKTDANQVAIETEVTRYLQKECDTFITYPGVNRLFFWTGKNPPTQLNSTGWGLLSHAQQEEIFAAVRKAKNPRILIVSDLQKTWQAGTPYPIKPLVTFVQNECLVVTNLGPFIVYSLKR